jgi:hypothetical protein
MRSQLSSTETFTSIRLTSPNIIKSADHKEANRAVTDYYRTSDGQKRC